MRARFSSLDRQTVWAGEYEEPDSVERIGQLFNGNPVIARGGGVSYVAASFGAQSRSIGMGRLNRVLSFDPGQKRVTVEAGISLGALYDYLLPHRLYLAVQPGHPQISVGGCVASNVHGKNPQKDGVFADVVDRLQLFHPAHGVLTLSRDENAALFHLTCGGFGLTGIILNVTLRLNDLPSSRVEVRKLPVRSLEDTCEQIEEVKSRYDFLYAWNDLARFDRRLGRGYVCCGRFATTAEPARERMPGYPILRIAPGSRRPNVLRRQIIPWATRLHFAWEMQRPTQEISLFDVLYPGMYSGRLYFDLYGTPGLFAHMVLLPHDRWRPYISKLETTLRRHREPLMVMAIKAFGGRQQLLTFNGSGFSLHFHVPNTSGGRQLLAALEGLSEEFQLIRTIYFDSRLTGGVARSLYPQYETFKEQLARHDPKRIFASDVSRRLDL